MAATRWTVAVLRHRHARVGYLGVDTPTITPSVAPIAAGSSAECEPATACTPGFEVRSVQRR
jgi:hypothetical protein